MTKNSGFTQGPVKLSVILASLLAVSCSNMNVRQGFLGSTPEQPKIEPSDVSPMPITELNNGDIEKLDKTDPKFILTEAARIAAEEGKHSEAFIGYEKLINQYPDYTQAYVAYATSGRKIGAHQQVLVKLFDYKTRNPEHAEISMEIAKVFYDLKDYEKALTEVDAATKFQDQNWKLYSLRGVIADKLNYSSEAEASYMKALELSPDNPTIMNNLAVSKMLAGNYNEAEYFAVKAMSSEKPSLQVYRTYAKVLAMKGDIDKAEKLLTDKLNDKEEAQKVISSVRTEVSKPVLWGRK